MNKSLLILISALIAGPFASAGDLEWSGVYRIEGYHIKDPELELTRP